MTAEKLRSQRGLHGLELIELVRNAVACGAFPGVGDVFFKVLDLARQRGLIDLIARNRIVREHSQTVMPRAIRSAQLERGPRD